jgi:hypothetical protein
LHRVIRRRSVRFYRTDLPRPWRLLDRSHDRARTDSCATRPSETFVAEVARCAPSASAGPSQLILPRPQRDDRLGSASDERRSRAARAAARNRQERIISN